MPIHTPSHRHRAMVAVAAAAAITSHAWAQTPIAINNPSFEDSASGTPVGWTNINGGGTVFAPGTLQYDPLTKIPDGTRIASVFKGTAGDGISQVLAATFQQDSGYTLTVEVGDPADEPFDGYIVQLLANGTVLEQDDNTQASVDGDFVTSTVTYTYDPADAALVGQPLEIRLISKGLATGDVNFDDIQLTVALGNPVAVPGGPYFVAPGESLSLDGSGSLPSAGETITTYEWDLDGDGDFDEAITGATPTAISDADLQATYGMVVGPNTINLQVTDSATKTSAIVAGSVILGSPTVIYEPFADADASLNGNATGSGLSGNWTSQANWAVDPGTLYWGALQTSGNQVRATTGANGGRAFASVGSTLTDSGLLAHGETLWFSMIYTTTPSVSGNPDAGFALGTNPINGTNNIPMDSAGSGIGFSVKNGQLQASTWASGAVGRSATADGGEAVTGSNRYLVVGEIIWGADGTATDTINIYFPDKALNLGPVVATRSVVLDQSNFQTISYAHKNDSIPALFDEIRFGFSYADVAPANTDALTLAPADFVDNKDGGPVLESDTLVYTVTFNKAVNAATVTDADFENAGTAPITINSVVVIDNKAFVTVTPTFPNATGTLQLQVKAAAVIEDDLGNALDTTSAITDDTIITVNDDTVLPTVLSITSTPAASPIYGLPTIPFVVTFDKYFMDDATVTADDFTNAGTASITVGAVTRISSGTSPAVYAFDVTPTSTGTLQLSLSGTVTDLNGNSAAVPVNDDTVYTFAANEPARQDITLVNSAQGSGIGGGAGSKTLAAGFDASGADKLVLVIGGEHGFGGNTGGRFYSASYAGQPMTEVIQEEVGIPTAAIFYIDNPSAISPGDVVVNQDNHNGSIFRIYALSGTAPGVGASNKSTTNPSSITMITSASKSMVIAGVLNAGPNGANGATNMSATLPLVEDPLSDLFSGSRWVTMCFGTGIIPTPDVGTFSFTGANGSDLLATVGVEIIPAVAPPTGSPYADWATTNAPNTGNDPSADEDGDGVPNAVEFVLGGDKDNSDLDLLPVAATSGGNMTFTFIRDQASADASVDLEIEVGTDLASWPAVFTVGADTAGSSAGVTVVDNGNGTDTITLTVVQAPDTRKFARMKVGVSP